ncbi:MAG: helix-turn-helix domain-containing protein [Saprospiraceae bacterium]
MTKKETAYFCKVSIATINRWMKTGRISYLKLGRKVLFNHDQVLQDLEKFIIIN